MERVKMMDEPYISKKFDLKGVKKCGARSRNSLRLCKQPAMKNGRCRFHGGMSTGPRTEKGLEASRRARFKHGLYSRGHIKIKREAKSILDSAQYLIKIMEEM